MRVTTARYYTIILYLLKLLGVVREDRLYSFEALKGRSGILAVDSGSGNLLFRGSQSIISFELRKYGVYANSDFIKLDSRSLGFIRIHVNSSSDSFVGFIIIF